MRKSLIRKLDLEQWHNQHRLGIRTTHKIQGWRHRGLDGCNPQNFTKPQSALSQFMTFFFSFFNQ